MMKTIRTREIAVLGLLALLSCRPGGRGTECLYLAMEDDVITLDPHLNDDSITHSVLSNIYDPLVAFDAQMRITPALAVSWENPNDLTWRFHLRPGVRFHSGARFTAKDVVYSIERSRGTEVGHYLSQVQRAVEVDSLTVDLVTDKPSPVLLNKLTFVEIVPRGSGKPILRPDGTGAYVFIDYQKGSFLELRANDGYWGGKPAIGRAVFKAIPLDHDRLQALLSGDILLARDMESEAKERIRDDQDLTFISQPGLGVSHLGINLKIKGPMASRMVRQAIYWALDPGEIARLSGLEAEPCDQLISPYIVGYLPGVRAERPDTAKARKLMREAGYGQGFRTTLELSTTAAATSGPVIARQLERIGIKVDVVGLEWTGFTERLKSRESPFYLIGWACSSGDASDLYDACLHTKTDAGYGHANHTGYSDPEIDRLIERSNQILNQRERIEILQQIQTVVLEDLPLIPLYLRNKAFGVSKRINFAPRQDARIKLIELSWAKRSAF